MSQPARATTADVRKYWNDHIHDLEITSHPVGSPGFFSDLDQYHFEKLHHLLRLVKFDAYHGQRVLEVGCGAGTDLVRFAQGGALVTGVDLSSSAIALARQNFAQHGLDADLREADGEQLPFADNTFDLVYAHGVVQYTADDQRLVDECRRVLKPGQLAIFQVYNRVSWLNALSKLMKVPLEHEDAPVLGKYSAGEFRSLSEGVQRGEYRRRAFSGQVAPPRRVEGRPVQHDVRGDIQRAAAVARAPLWMAPTRVLPQMKLIKAHAFGNDFLLIDAYDFSGLADPLTFTRDVCSRHRGIGADGLIVFETRSAGASMQLFNADGSRSEISGNGVRCLAAWIASTQQLEDGTFVDVETDAGVKSLELLDRREGRYTFCAAMGQPERIEQVVLDVDGESVTAVTLRVGNPQCVVLGEVTDARLQTIGRALAVHSHFPEGTNVELATVEAPNRVRILIWERGVGPTESSGTGSCAAAVAAISFGGASRDVQIVAPGGTQRVEWDDEGLFLTGWAEIIAESHWLKP